MKKILFALAVSGCLTFSAFAQQTGKAKVSIGLEGGVPVGDASATSSYVVGGSLKFEKPIASGLAFTLSGGYIYFTAKNDVKIDVVGFGGAPSGEGFVPLKAGLKYYFNDNLYAEGQAGAAISTVSGNNVAFAYSPGVGVLFARNLDFGVRFESWTKNGGSLNQFALRIAYDF